VPDAAKYLLLTVGLAALVFGPLSVWYRQDQLAEIQSELAASIPDLADEQTESCRKGFNGADDRLRSQWRPIVDYYAWLLCAMDEPPLPRALPHEGLVLRLLVVPSFDPPYMIRAQSFPFEPKMYAVQLTNSTGQTNVAWRAERELTREQWGKLAATIDEMRFWDLSRPMPYPGIDGSAWVLEASSNDRYHAVERWSGGELEPVGFLLAEPFGIQIY